VLNAGDVGQDIDAAHARGHLPHDILDLRTHREIHVEVLHRVARAAQSFGGFPAGFVVAVEDRHRAIAHGEFAGRGMADTGSASGHDDYFAGEIHQPASAARKPSTAFVRLAAWSPSGRYSIVK
jgi:hypothetical protein